MIAVFFTFRLGRDYSAAKVRALFPRETRERIGALYGIHRATAARWIAAAREELGGAIRAELDRLLGILRRHPATRLCTAGELLEARP